MNFELLNAEPLIEIGGVLFPADVEVRKLLITGPPGTGKSTLIQKLRGWPEERYLDLTRKNWWTHQVMLYRPCEVHLCLPFRGFKQGLTVFDPEWLESRPAIEYDRIRIPSPKRRWFNVDWRTRIVFEFIVLPPELTFELRNKRAYHETHPVDRDLRIEDVIAQSDSYIRVAYHLHCAGLQVYLRDGFENSPKRFVVREN